MKSFETALGADVRAEQKEAHEAAAARPEPELPVTITPSLEQNPTEPSKSAGFAPQPGIVVPVHTLKDDLQHVVHDQKISVVRAVSLEEKRRFRDKPAEDDFASAPKPRAPKHVFAVLFSVVLFVLLGVGALLGVYTVERARSTPTILPNASTILFAENSVALPLGNQSPTALKQLIAQSRASSGGALGSIAQIIPTISSTDADGVVSQRSATFAEFMRAVGADPPDELLRAVSNDFFFGIHTVDKQAPLIIAPVTSYDHAFAGMLAWEATMNAALAPMFTSLPAQTTDTSGLPALRAFSDVVMRNYDVRALKDDSGAIQLYYSFPTQNVLIIAESPYTFTEVLSRLQALRKL